MRPTPRLASSAGEEFRHEPRPDLYLVRPAAGRVAARPLPAIGPGARRGRRAADRAARPPAPGRGAPLPDDAPRAGDRGDEPAGAGVRLPDGAGVQARLR